MLFPTHADNVNSLRAQRCCIAPFVTAKGSERRWCHKLSYLSIIFSICKIEHDSQSLPFQPTQARCSEDQLRNKIKALEAQLQVCLQVRTAAGGAETNKQC